MTNLYLPFYFEWINFIHSLPDEEYGKLIRAVFDYAVGRKRKKTTFSPTAEMAYKFITAAISRSEQKRHMPEKETAPRKRKKETKTFKRVERSTNEPQKVSYADVPAAPEKSEPKNESQHPKEELKKAPTRDEVHSFFKKRGFRSNPDEFFNFYESNGWRVGQNPMQNWYSSAENWELRTQKEETAAKPTDEPRRYGDFDIHEAFKLALERSYGSMDDDES